MADFADEPMSEFMSGASEVYPQQASSLRKNGFVVLKGRPCKIEEMSTSKETSKIHFVGIDIFTEKKYEEICPSTHNMDVPTVTRNEYQLVDILDGFVDIMEDSGDTRADIKLPEKESLSTEIKERFDKGDDLYVIVLKAMGGEQIIGVN